MNALDNDPNFIKVFPYKIKDDKLSVLFQDGTINYSDFEKLHRRQQQMMI